MFRPATGWAVVEGFDSMASRSTSGLDSALLNALGSSKKVNDCCLSVYLGVLLLVYLFTGLSSSLSSLSEDDSGSASLILMNLFSRWVSSPGSDKLWRSAFSLLELSVDWRLFLASFD